MRLLVVFLFALSLGVTPLAAEPDGSVSINSKGKPSARIKQDNLSVGVGPGGVNASVHTKKKKKKKHGKKKKGPQTSAHVGTNGVGASVGTPNAKVKVGPKGPGLSLKPKGSKVRLGVGRGGVRLGF